MEQQHDSRLRSGTTGATHLIEKGWTVYDALEHPIGTITDVDTTRNVLTIDGRPVGLSAFEVPLDLVIGTGGSEVRLSKVVETAEPGDTATLRLVDAPAQVTTSTAARARPRARTETTSSGTTPTATSRTADATSSRPNVASTGPTGTPAGRATTSSFGSASAGQAPTSAESFSQFSPPYANAGAGANAGADRSTPETGRAESDGSGGWGMKKIGMAALAVGGLAAAGYLMRRRARRKSRYERFRDSASGYLGFASGYASDLASEIARQRHPAWLAALAAAALPLAYYAWPSAQPTFTEQAKEQPGTLAGTLGAHLYSLTSQGRGWMSSMDGSDMPRSADWMPSSWRSASPSGWSMPGDWSVKPDVAVPVGLLALSALALYLARRGTARPTPDARIRDVMTRKLRVIQPDATVADAAAMMRHLNVGALPVCDGSRLIGMVTDRDITTRSTAEGHDPHLTPVRDVMSPGVAWASEDDPVEEAARIMREHQIRRLPIVDERHSLVGVVSLGDLATEVGDDTFSGETLERISQ